MPAMRDLRTDISRVEERVAASSGSDRAPVFSVIVPVHNKARHVEAALRSVLNQSFRGFEIIVVDDASTDGSREIVESIATPLVRLLGREAPGPGGYAARNLGTSVAIGDWITFLDADDEWSPDRLERLRAAIQRFPEVNLHACAWHVATRDGRRRPNKYSRMHESRGPHLVTLKQYLSSLRRNRPIIHTDTVAIRRSALPDAAVFPADVGLRRGGDGYAWLRLMCRERSLVWSPDVGASYFVDSDNMVTRTVKVDVDAFARPLVMALEGGLTAPERRWLRQAANGLLWHNWVNEVLQGRPGFGLRQHLFWRGAWAQALVMALGSTFPPGLIRGLRRLASSARGSS